MDIQTVFGNRLKEIRIKKKISQIELAALSGIDRTYLSHIEAGKRNISLDTIQKILAAINVSYKYFFNAESFKFD